MDVPSSNDTLHSTKNYDMSNYEHRDLGPTDQFCRQVGLPVPGLTSLGANEVPLLPDKGKDLLGGGENSTRTEGHQKKKKTETHTHTHKVQRTRKMISIYTTALFLSDVNCHLQTT